MECYQPETELEIYLVLVCVSGYRFKKNKTKQNKIFLNLFHFFNSFYLNGAKHS